MKTPVIERAGHAPFLSRPDAFEETLRSLLHD
jgi:pimeloyl-[acyl-carrier protein] methyl ester esterase